MLKKIFAKLLVVGSVLNILAYIALISEVESSLSSIQTPAAYSNDYCNVPINNVTNLHMVYFVPDVSIAALVFVGFFFGFIILCEIMYNSSGQYKINYDFDLIIFKPVNKVS